MNRPTLVRFIDTTILRDRYSCSLYYYYPSSDYLVIVKILPACIETVLRRHFNRISEARDYIATLSPPPMDLAIWSYMGPSPFSSPYSPSSTEYSYVPNPRYRKVIMWTATSIYRTFYVDSETNISSGRSVEDLFLHNTNYTRYL